MSEPRQLPSALLQEIAKTNFGEVYTNPLQSHVVKTAVATLLGLVATQVFGVQLSDAQTASWVSTILTAVGLIGVIWVRCKTSGAPIQTLSAAVAELLPTISSVADENVRRDLMNVLRSKNPLLHDALEQALRAMPSPNKQ